MKIYTSYFGNIRKMQSSGFGGAFVSVAGHTPEWFKYGKCAELAPKKSWWQEWKNRFGQSPDSDESMNWYIQKYMDTVLSVLQPYQLVNDLERKYGDVVALTCYEKPDRFCHRHIIRGWLNASGIQCEEFGEQ